MVWVVGSDKWEDGLEPDGHKAGDDTLTATLTRAVT